MILGYLIVFQYAHLHLPGAHHDLEQAKAFLTKIGAKLCYLTDIHLEGVEPVISVIDLMQSLDRSASQLDRVIVYYSGHGEQNSMVLPNQQLVPFLELRDLILERCLPTAQILFLLDCCYPGTMNLPLVFEDRFRLLPLPHDYLSQQIILITSTPEKEQAVSTYQGSPFTWHLFAHLTELVEPRPIKLTKRLCSIPSSRCRSYTALLDYLRLSLDHDGYHQRVVLRSNYYQPPLFWSWIGLPQELDIMTDLSHHQLYLVSPTRTIKLE